MPNHPTPIHVICIQWGTAYTAKDVNRLESMVRRNTTMPMEFHLFSNETLEGLSESITQHPEPGLKMPDAQGNLNYRKTVGLCDDDLGGLKGQRVFFFDLDTLIVGNLDPMFQYPQDEHFYIINDWNSRGERIGQASCYSFVVGTLGFIKERFESDPDKVIGRYKTATQQFLSAMIIERFERLRFWPDEWCRSFKFHCLHPIFIRRLFMPRKPTGETMVLAFHGSPNIEDAIQGRWQNPNNVKRQSWWKRFYKKFRKTDWILEYWK